MKIGLVTLNPTVGDISGNLEKILSHIQVATQRKCDLIIFPELALIGYPPKDYLFYKPFLNQQNKALDVIKRRSKKIVVVLGGFAQNRGTGAPFKNELFIFQNGQRYTYTKQLLPNYGVFDEHRYFEPGRDPLILKIHGKKCGFSICEDIWATSQTPEHRYVYDPLSRYEKNKIDLLINCSASPFEVGKLKLRHELLHGIAQRLNCGVIYVNQSGANDDLIFDGGSYVYNAQGQLLFEHELFREHLSIFDLSHHKQAMTPVILSEVEQMSHALILGLRDYCHKTGFRNVLLGLSGGIDSALVAWLAAQALGHENVLAVLLPSRYSSKQSLSDAQKLVERLKIKSLTIKIEDLHKEYEKIFKKIFGKKTLDLTEQNIQARIRGNLLMAISNNEHRLLLNTTNKSEMACGYGTLYGDLCGGLAVLSDVDKLQVYELARWINREAEMIPKEIIAKAPSAELKPNQRDTDSLPPYELLDPWLKEFIIDRVLPGHWQHNNLTSQQLAALVLRAEYKRQQAPIGLRISKTAFGSGRRFPIAANLTP